MAEHPAKQEMKFWENLLKSGEDIDLRYARDLPDDTPQFILKMLGRFEREVAEFSFEGCKGRVLDAGCGNGNILMRAMSHFDKEKASGEDARGILLENRIRYVGLDFSRNMLCRAASRSSKADFAQGCVDHLPFKDKTFDRVVSSGVMTCLPTIDCMKESLSEFHRVLKVGGVLVVDFFNQQSHYTRVRKTLFREAINPPEYISPPSFKTFLEEAGFEVNALKGFDYKPCQGYFFMSPLRPIFDPCFVQERLSSFIEANVVPKMPGISRFGYRIYVRCIKLQGTLANACKPLIS
jgi:ubiquinone/menaquinone biosynthesis C-methylase UbiE